MVDFPYTFCMLLESSDFESCADQQLPSARAMLAKSQCDAQRPRGFVVLAHVYE